MLKIVLLFIFANLIQIEEETHLQVRVCFPDYAFYENIHTCSFHEWDVFLIHLFNDRHKNERTHLFWVSRKKETFACTIFSLICYVACAINCADQVIACMPACMRAIAQVSLTSMHLKAKFNKTIVVFIMEAIVHQTSWSFISHWRNYSKIN